MPDMEKVIKGLELIILEVDHNSMWLPGDDDIRNAITLLKQQKMDIIALKNAYKELAEKGSVIVKCKDCKHSTVSENGLIKCGHTFRSADFFCADGEKRD